MKQTFRLLPVLLPLWASAQSIIYVDHNASGLNNGASWSNAYTNLHAALTAAQPGDEIWVAEGVYRPSADNRSVYFEQPARTRLCGGFAGTENTLAERDLSQHITIIDGDIGVPGDSTDNSYTLLLLNQPDEGTLIDGLEFRNAVANSTNAGSTSPEASGGAIFAAAGAGKAFPHIVNCRFYNNTARLHGGACYFTATTNGMVAPVFTRCLFSGNRSASGLGGAVYVNGGNNREQRGDFEDCRFEGNFAASNGGAIYYGETARTDTIELRNCTFEKNFSQAFGGGYYTAGRNTGALLNIRDCMFKANKAKIGAGFCHFSGGNPIKWVNIESCTFDSNELYVPSPGVTHYSAALSFFAGYFASNDQETRQFYLQNNRFYQQPESALDVVLWFGTIKVQGNVFDACGNAEYSTVDSFYFQNNTVRNCTNSFSVSGSTKPGATWFVDNLFAKNNVYKAVIRCGTPHVLLGNAFVDNVINNSDAVSSEDSVICTAVNNIFHGNRNAFFLAGISWRIPLLAQPSMFYNNLFDFAGCDSLPNPFVCGQNNLYNAASPFIDKENGNYALSPCSEAVNAGQNQLFESLGVLSDNIGNPRIRDGHVDLGPFEVPDMAFEQSPMVTHDCAASGNGSVSFSLRNACLPYTVQWTSNGAAGNTTDQLSAGEYLFTLTDARGRVLSDTLLILQGAPVAFSQSTTAASCATCADGSVAVSFADPAQVASMEWSTGSTTSSLAQVLPGDYQLSVTDVMGCVQVFSFTVGALSDVSAAAHEWSWRVSPNPVSGILQIEAREGALLELYNALGVRVLSQAFEAGSTLIQLPSLPGGQYQLLRRNAVSGRVEELKHLMVLQP